MANLSPCPFCGTTPPLSNQMFRTKALGEHIQWHVACGNSSCRVRPATQWCLTEQEAVECWETRSKDSTLPQSLAQLRQHMLAVSAQLSATKLDYAGVHAIELAGAASMVDEWSRDMPEKTKSLLAK